jgi:hypothetical protein
MRGWWGDEPPYHTDVFVLTHHPRKTVEVAGGTTFHFVTDGVHAAHVKPPKIAMCASAAGSPRFANICCRA